MIRNRICPEICLSIRSHLLILALITALASLPVCVNAQEGAPAKPEEKSIAPASEATIDGFAFDVVAVKPFKQEGQGRNMMTRFTPSGITAQGVSLQRLVLMAWGLEENQIVNVPSWLDSDSFEVDAKMDEESAVAFKKLSDKDQMKALQHMMQAMLADRFKLATHKETRDLPVYNLVVAKGGPKIQEAKEGDTYPNGIKGPDGHSSAGMMRMGPGDLTMQGGEITNMVSILSDQLGRHVLDKTGLKGKYDITLKWAPEDREGPEMKGAASSGNDGAHAAPPESSGPTIFAAIQEQLGLKLEAAKAPVEVLSIDHAEKPSAN